MRKTYVFALVVSMAATGCSGERDRDIAVSESRSRDLELPPSDTLAPTPLPDPARAAADTARSQDLRAQVGARTGVPVEPRAKRPAKKRPAPSRTSDPAPVATGAYAPGANGADTVAVTERGPEGLPADTANDSTAASAGRTTQQPAVATPRPAPAAPPAPPVAPPDTAAAAVTTPQPRAAAANALPVGTQFRARLQDTINSLRNSEGQTVTAQVSGDVRAPDGLTVLPSGSTVYVYIARLRPARTRSAKDGELELRVDSITVPGHSYAVRADVGPVPHELRGRGVTAGEVEKVGAGAAAGAVVGGVVTGKTKGAVIGGVIGAAGGTVVAAHTASRDVVVTPGTLLTLVLREPVTRVER